MYASSVSLQSPCQGYALAESTECSVLLYSQLLKLGVVSVGLLRPSSFCIGEQLAEKRVTISFCREVTSRVRM